VSTMSLPRLEVSMQPAPIPLDIFTAYLVTGDHWRAGRALTALRRHQEGYVGPMNTVSRDGQHVAAVKLHPDFVDHLDHEQHVTPRLRQRWDAVEWAMREVEGEEKHECIEALRYFLTPDYRRRKSARAQAIAWDIAESTLWSRRDIGVRLVWEELRLAGKAGLWASM